MFTRRKKTEDKNKKDEQPNHYHNNIDVSKYVEKDTEEQNNIITNSFGAIIAKILIKSLSPYKSKKIIPNILEKLNLDTEQLNKLDKEYLFSYNVVENCIQKTKIENK